ncbi:MAG TPA: MFS transporter [Acidimicrobiia bacterium]|jgi:predicted MFS family arabinose efflux permease|nr:MFS transporter [Acidimicrobiia bacterium]
MPSSRRGSRWAVVGIVVLAAMVAQGFGRFTYALVLPAVQEDLGISYTLAGAFGTANLTAYLVGTALVAITASRVPLDRMMRIGILGSAAGLIAMWWSPTLGVLAAAMVLTGLSGAWVWIPAPGVSASLISPERRGLAIGLVGTGIGLGFVLAGWASRSVASDWRTLYGTEAVVAVITASLVWIFLRTHTEDRADRRPSLDALKAVPGWRRLVVAYAAYGLAMSLFVNFLVARLEEDAGFGPATTAFVFSAFGVATIFGGPVFGPLSDRIGRSRAMTIGFSAMSAAAVLALVGTQPWPSVAAVIFGLAFAGVPTSLAAQISDHLTTQQFGAAFGTITLAFGAAQMLGPQIGGWIGDQTGSFTLVFLLAAGIAVIGATAARGVPDRTTMRLASP